MKTTKNLLLKTEKGFTLVEIMIVVAITGILLAIAAPVFLRARERTRMRACQVNLAQMDAAKSQWLLETKKPGTSEPMWDELIGLNGYIRLTPQCPSLGTYSLGTGQVLPTCTFGTTDRFAHIYGGPDG